MIPVLLVAIDDDKVIGFAGIYENKLEMLFIDPAYFGQGMGYKLINYCFEQYNIQFVDVNEQNPRAFKFYQRQGFSVIERSPLDSDGRPFPILHMQKNSFTAAISAAVFYAAVSPRGACIHQIHLLY